MGVWGATPEPKHSETGFKKLDPKNPRKLVGGKDREENVTGEGSCYIESFCATGDKGYMGQDTHALQ